MKSRNITNIIIEGANGVGKTTLQQNLLKHYNYTIPVYDRGEFSNFVYSKIYNRPFSAMQRHLPFLYIFLYCDKKQLAERINNREDKSDLDKLDEQDLFLDYLDEFKRDYHVIEIDTTNMTQNDVLNEAILLIEDYVEKLKNDPIESYSSWNKAYAQCCKKYGHDFYVRDNQPYFDGFPLMAETNLHNGRYETFTDKSVPHNLIYCQQYSQKPYITRKSEDFVYIINSKIHSRQEVYDYYDTFVKNNLTCITGVDAKYDNPLIKPCERVFGDDYIKVLSRARATVYIGRKMEYLKYVSTRLYESILADNIIFVDKLSDLNSDILKQIHNNDEELIELLTVTPENIVNKYEYLLKCPNVVLKILLNQKNYYINLKEEVLHEK